MPTTPETIDVEITPKGDRPVLHFSQYDKGRPFICNLLWEGEAYEPNDITIELHVRKVDGNIVSIASDSVTANAVTFKSTEQMCACFGKNIGELVLIDGDDNIIASKDIDIMVQRDVFQGGVDSASEIANLTTQIEEITQEVIGENYYTKDEVDALDTAIVNSIPTKTSDLTNDSGYITSNDLPDMSQYYNKGEVDDIAGDILAAIPTKTSDLLNDSGFTTIDDNATVNNKTWSSNKINEEIINILPTGTATGLIASFNTSLALPLINSDFEFDADANGVSVINVIHGGSNCVDESTLTNGFIANDGSIADNPAYRCTDFIELPDNASNVVERLKTSLSSARLYRVAFYDSNKAFIEFGYSQTLEYADFSISVPISSGAKYFRANVGLGREVWYIGINVNTSNISLGSTYYNGGKLTIDKEGHRSVIADGVTVDLPSGSPITALVGANNVYCDTGNTTVKYKQTIDEAIASLQALILSI